MSNNEWEPAFEDFTDCKVEMSDSFATTHSGGRNEYGVMVQQPDHPYTGEGAIFWIDQQNIYLRYAWDVWYTVAIDDLENCQAICRRRTGTLYVCSLTSISQYPVKIYHIDSLPQELFGEAEKETAEETGGESAEGKRSEGNEVPDDQAFVKEAVCCRNGNCIAESEDNQFPAAFYELNGHFLCVSFFGQTGDWLADEESFGDDPWPVWYGESSTAISPFAAAVAFREKIQSFVAKDVPFHSIVVLGSCCSVINESEFALSWEAKRVSFVRPEALEGSGLLSVGNLLDGLEGKPRPSLATLGAELSDALDSFTLKTTEQETP